MRLPVSSGLGSRFVAGEDTDDAVRVSRSLVEQGLHVTLDHLGEDTTDVEHATAVADAYLTVLGRLADAGLTSGTEVSVKLSAVGQALPGDGALGLPSNDPRALPEGFPDGWIRASW